MVDATLQMVKNISDRDLLEMKEMDERLSIIMNFYCIMSIAVFFEKPTMMPFVASRTVQLTMEYGLCKHSISGFVNFAAILCSNKEEKKGIESASQIGRAAMSCSKKRYNTPDQLPFLYLVYNSFIAPYTEPLQTCADMLWQGFNVGMSLGESGIAFFNSIQHIRIAVMAGERLPTLLEKVDFYLEQTNTYQNEIAKAYHYIYRDTILILINKAGTSGSSHHAVDVPTDSANAKVLEAIYFQRAIQAYWQGHNERCQYYIGKFLLRERSNMCRLRFIMFINGMNSSQLLKNNSSRNTRSISKKELKSVLKNAIEVLKTAARHMCWNFLNKVRYNQCLFDALLILLHMMYLNSFLQLLQSSLRSIF
jgi:hypothetical protein